MRANNGRRVSVFAPAAWVAFASLAGCHSVSERRLTDTEGRQFLAKCERSGACNLSLTSGSKRNDQKIGFSLLHTGRLVGICDVIPGQPAEGPADCRALVCQSDGDCPPAHGLKNGQCLNALCSDPAQALVPPDAVMLCLAGSGLGNAQARQIERYALGLNCGNPCKVPALCRQP